MRGVSSRPWCRHPAATALIVMAMALPTCSFPTPTAPSDATIAISANPLTLSLNGDRATVTVLLNNNDGTPVHDGTVVNFTTTLGSMPPTAETRDGVAKVTLTSGDGSGLATVRAQSGTTAQGAEIEVVIGPVVDSLTLTADPATLPITGGKSRITAVVQSPLLEPLEGVPVVFSTNAGTLSSGGNPVLTNASGIARSTLTTDRSATVRAAVGSLTSSVAVGVDQVDNAVPTATFTLSPSNPQVGDSVAFNGSASNDIDGTIVDYSWDLGDGSTASGARVSHTYTSPRTYTVLLVVTDNLGATASSSQSVTVSGGSPVASFTFSPTAPDPGDIVSFDASTSFAPAGHVVEYSWDWGDNTSPTVSGSPDATHTFTSNGTFTVRLTVRDNENATTSTSVSINVGRGGNSPPTASFTVSPTNPTTGDTVSFNASASSDSDGSIVSYSWDFGDGTTATGDRVAHAYGTARTYTVVLTVIDNAGASATSTATLTVSP